MKKIVLLFCLSFSMLITAQEKQAETPKIVIKVSLGETVHIEGLAITFTSVLEDSRCPKNVNCVWQGRAIVQVTVKDPSGTTMDRNIIFGQVKENESSSKVIYDKDGYWVEALALHPYPKYETEMAPYSLLIYKKD